MAEIVGGDLYSLWRVSDVLLPRVADVYYDAARAIAAAADGDGDAFASNRPAGPGGALMTSAGGAAWAALRDELQRMYVQIGTTVLHAGEALRRARQAYIDADLANADALDAYRSNPINHDPTNRASNPPLPGDDDYPGEPPALP